MARSDQVRANPFAAPEADLEPDFEQRESGRILYASFWARLVATLIDGFIIQCVMIIVAAVVLVAAGVTSNDPARAILLILLIGFLFGWLYNAFQESAYGQATLGKRMMGLKVVDLSGHRISFGRASRRYLGKTFSAFILLIGFLIQPLSDKKQALHDSFAGTLVIEGEA